jgi:hypothetical protein
MNAAFFLSVRALHVLMAALWIGGTVFLALVLAPAVEASGSSGAQLMLRMHQRLSNYMRLLGTTTAISGVYLLWRFTGGFDAGVSASHAGLAFGAGGTAGILAGIIGGAVVGRCAGEIARLTMAPGSGGHGSTGDAMKRVAALQRRMKAGTRAVILLQLSALTLMAVGHYV